MITTTTKKNKGRGDINTNSKMSDRNPIHVYNPIITPRATHMSHARVPVILDEDIRRNYLNQHSKKHGNNKRRISSGSNSGNGSGNGSMSNSSSSYENRNTDGGRDLLERQPTRRIVSPDVSKRPQQGMPLSSHSNQLRVDTKRPTQTAIMRRHQGKILDQDAAMTTDPHLKEHHLWDEFGFQKCSSSYSCSLDDCSTVGTSTSRRQLLKSNHFLNSSFLMKEEEEEHCNSRDASNHRGKTFSISKLIQIKSRHNKKKKEHGRKGSVGTGGGATTTATTVSMQDCDVVSGSKWVEVDDDCFDFQRSDKFGQDGHMDPPIFLNNVKNEIHNVAAAFGGGGGGGRGGDESDFKSLPETEISMDPINAHIPQYTFDVQTYGEKVQKYDTMRMVGKYRLAYESMILDEMTGDLDRYYTTTTTTPSELSGIGVGNGVVDGAGDGADELLSDSLMSRKSRKGMGWSSGAVDRSIATPTIETLGDKTHSMDQKARVLDKFNSHDEMSPLVMRNKTHIESRRHHEHIHDHVHDTPTRKNTNCVSTEEGGTKVVRSPSRPNTIDKGPRQMKNISHDEIMSPRGQNKITKNHDAIITDESMVESANENANVSLEASEVHILHRDKEQVHSTPKKAKNTKKNGGGGPFLDNSWQPSPIQPEGSFAIFNDSQVVPLHKYETLAIISKPVQTSPEPIQTDEKPDSRLEFLKIVAAIVIQTFFRRHLAYKLACKRYGAVLKIQRFLGSILERKKFQQAVMKHTAFQFYDLAAIQIQAAWRGWWVRDCLNVETYCACMIQKVFRSYLARMQYRYDLYRIVLAQSVIRRFLALSVVKSQTTAATKIQTNWRKAAAKNKYINILVDVLIVQSVCRRFLALKRIGRIKRNMSTHGKLISGKNITSKNYPAISREPSRRRADNMRQVEVDLNQMNSIGLIQKWESRRR